MNTLTKRPSLYSDEVINVLATQALPTIKQWMQSESDGNEWDGCSEDEILDDLKSALKYETDGYKMAKELDDWCPDTELVDILDNLAHQKYEIHKQVIATWVFENNIVLDKKVGDTVTCRNDTGRIVKIDKETAQYHVNIPQLGHLEYRFLETPNGFLAQRVDESKSGTLSIIVNCEDIK